MIEAGIDAPATHNDADAVIEMSEAGDELHVFAHDLETYVRVYRTPHGWVLSERKEQHDDPG